MATNYAVQVFGPEAGGTPVTVGAASASQSVGSATRILMTSTTDCHIRFGTSSVVAVTTDWLLPAKTPVIFDIENGKTYFAAIQDSAAGTITWAAVQ